MIRPVYGPSGLGVFIFEDGVISHAGFDAGFLSIFLINPTAKPAVAIMANPEISPSAFDALFNHVPASSPFRM